MHYTPKTKPFKHQAQASIRAVKEGSMAFFMEPGTGKTKAALDAIAMQALRGKCRRVAVLAPLIALDVWSDEVEEHFPYPAFLHDTDYEWQVNDADNKKDLPDVSFFFINYDKISRRTRRGKRWIYPYVDELEEFDPDILVLDESHRCKRASANRSQALYRLASRIRDRHPLDVYLLSGTPHPKGYIDLFSQFRIMDPTVFGTSKQTFEDFYCQYGFGVNRFRIIRYRNKAHLVKQIKSKSFIRTKEECLDLPPVMPPQLIKVPLPPSAQKQYLSMVNDFVAWIEDPTDVEGEPTVVTAKNAGARRVRLQQITGGFTTDGTCIHTAKVDAASAVLEDLFDQEEKVVVYARFLAEVDAVQSAIRKLGVPSVAITGSVKSYARTRAIEQFQKSDGPRALVFQVTTGSLAITLTSCANVLFYSLPDSWETLFQCISRFDRIGQTRAISQRYLVCPGTLDVRSFQTLKDKRDMHSELMGNPKGFLLGE